MVTTPLDLKYIYRRGRGLERLNTINESARIPDLSGDMNDDFYHHKVEAFLMECTSYEDAVNLLETLYQNDKFDLLESATQKVINDVIPTVKSAELPGCINCINSSDIGDVNKDRLTETAKLYKSIDRITKNHNNIAKRFEMNFKGKSDKEKCYKVCEMVCTYNLNKFIKFNIALEELAYLGFTNGDRMPDEVMVEHVLNYFLMMDDNDPTDISNYRDAINESKIICEGADVNVGYFTNGVKKSRYWKDKLNEWKVDAYKDIDTLVELARENFSDIYALNNIMEHVNDFIHINNIDFDPMTIFIDEELVFNGDSAHNVINVIEENNLSNAEDVLSNLRTIWEAELNDEVYDDGTKRPETFTSDEIDKFELHNMITDAQSVGEFLDQLEKSSMKESPLKIGKVVTANDTDINESNIVDYVDSNGYISMKLRSYTYEGAVDDVHDLLESSIKCINNILYNSNHVAYYTLSENYFDISMRSRYKIVLSEAQEAHRGFTTSDKQTICDIKNWVEAVDTITESPIGLITDRLMDESYAATVTPQEVSLLSEIMNPYLTRDTWNTFLDTCRVEANPKYDQIKHIVSSLKEEEFDAYADHNTVLEFALDVMNLNEGIASNIKKATGDIAKPFNKNKTDTNKQPEAKNFSNGKDKESSDNSNDDAKKAINSINDAKLAWQGVKAKMKGASAKEQEMCRDLDMEFNHLLNTFKATYGTDHREEIITGEVNHSISKIIKIGIALAGVGAIAHSAVIPIIGAVALFAKSKHTSLKEKKLIIDEIDVELQVLEREIQRAEQSGSTKKYRQLLTIQKNIQRRRQEIYYSLAKKGRRIPMQSTQGLRGRE